MGNFISGDFFSRFNRSGYAKETDSSSNTEKILKKADRNRDGKVSIEEFKKATGFNVNSEKSIDEKFLDFDIDGDGNFSKEEITDLTKILDSNNDGRLSFKEKNSAKNFFKYSAEEMKLDKATINSAGVLSKADSDRDGRVTINEFARTLGFRRSDESVLAKLAKLDADGDGRLTAGEVSEFIAKIDQNGNDRLSYSEKSDARAYVKLSDSIVPPKPELKPEPAITDEVPADAPLVEEIPVEAEVPTTQTPVTEEIPLEAEVPNTQAPVTEEIPVEAEVPNTQTPVVEDKPATPDAPVVTEVKPSLAEILKTANFLNKVDSNKDSKVSYAELAKSMGIYNPDEKLLEKIAKFDKNMDGELSAEEVAKLVAQLDADGNDYFGIQEQENARNIFKFSDNPYSS